MILPHDPPAASRPSTVAPPPQASSRALAAAPCRRWGTPAKCRTCVRRAACTGRHPRRAGPCTRHNTPPAAGLHSSGGCVQVSDAGCRVSSSGVTQNCLCPPPARYLAGSATVMGCLAPRTRLVEDDAVAAHGGEAAGAHLGLGCGGTLVPAFVLLGGDAGHIGDACWWTGRVDGGTST